MEERKFLEYHPGIGHKNEYFIHALSSNPHNRAINRLFSHGLLVKMVEEVNIVFSPVCDYIKITTEVWGNHH